MSTFQNPGAFFLGTLVASEQKFLKTLIGNALKNGYTKFIEPCAGAFAMSHLAVQVGFKPNQIYSSDVSMFTTIMGYAITGKSLKELGLKARGFTDEELLDPAVALYAWKYLSLTKNAEKDYFYNYLIDMEQRREEHIDTLKAQLERAKKLLCGMNYRALDMWKHLEEVSNDSQALVIINPPTYKAGFEKWYSTNGNMTWNEPLYDLFDPKVGLEELFKKMGNARCLMVCYEENEPNKTAGKPVFVRYGVRENINVYLTANRPDEAEELANGKKAVRSNEEILKPLNCLILPTDCEIKAADKVHICKIERKNAQYYRKLWTHNFMGVNAMINVGVFINDQIVGVFGINTAQLSIGAYGENVSDSIFLMYGMTLPHIKYRLGRLVTMLAQNKDTVQYLCTDLECVKAKTLKTIMMSKYPESKEMRGIMKLVERKPDERHGYRLMYMSDLKNRTAQETLIEWLGREEKWRKSRTSQK